MQVGVQRPCAGTTHPAAAAPGFVPFLVDGLQLEGRALPRDKACVLALLAFRAATSSFKIVPMALPSPRVAPLTLVMPTLKVSFGSTPVSPLMFTSNTWRVRPASI